MSRLTKREKAVTKDIVKTAVYYVIAGIVIDKALDIYIKH